MNIKTKKLEAVYLTGSYVIVWFLILITRQRVFSLLLRPERIIKPVIKTNKETYLVERDIYRLAHGIVKLGVPLEKRDYYIYKLIAQKYDWLYIKETYDNS